MCDFRIQQHASNMRNVLMDHLLSHASDRTASGMTLSELAMLRASEIESELKKKTSSRDAIVSTLEDYAFYCDLPIQIDASMQTHRNYIWSLSVTP
jgi:hypothetical protein